MTKGFPIINYVFDFPLSIQQLIVPQRIEYEKEKENSDENHDLEYSEKITNSNLLDTNFVNNIGRNRGEHHTENSKIFDVDDRNISIRRNEEGKESVQLLEVVDAGNRTSRIYFL